MWLSSFTAAAKKIESQDTHRIILKFIKHSPLSLRMGDIVWSNSVTNSINDRLTSKRPGSYHIYSTNYQNISTWHFFQGLSQINYAYVFGRLAFSYRSRRIGFSFFRLHLETHDFVSLLPSKKIWWILGSERCNSSRENHMVI